MATEKQASPFHRLPIRYVGVLLEYLAVGDGLALRRTCTFAHAGVALASRFRQRTLKQLLTVQGPPPGKPSHWCGAPIATDTHVGWLLTDLRALSFIGAPFITDATMEVVGAACPRLESLRLFRGRASLRSDWRVPLSKLTAAGVTAVVRGCPLLKSLVLSWCESVQSTVVCQAIANSPLVDCLTELNLDGMGVNDAGVAALSNCRALQVLRMKDPEASDVSGLGLCPLRSVHLCRGISVAPASIVEMATRAAGTLQGICCAGNRRFDNASAVAVLAACPHLTYFDCLRRTSVGNLDLGGRHVKLDNPH